MDVNGSRDFHVMFDYMHADIDCSSVYPVAQVQQMDFSLDKDHTAWLEQEFVNGRQQGNTPTVDDFHRQLTVR